VLCLTVKIATCLLPGITVRDRRTDRQTDTPPVAVWRSRSWKCSEMQQNLFGNLTAEILEEHRPTAFCRFQEEEWEFRCLCWHVEILRYGYTFSVKKKQVLRFFTYRIHSQVHTVVRDDGRTTWTYVGWADRIRQNKGISVFHLFCCWNCV